VTDPLIAVTTAEILKLAFNEFIKSGAGETAKKLTGAALTKASELRQEIVTWFKGKQNVKAEKAITTIQEQGNAEAFSKLFTYLDDEMEIEPIFARNLQQLAQQVINIQNMSNKLVQFGEMKQVNRDNAKGIQVQAHHIARVGDDYSK
jgi:uncharacterized protein YrzB (UPF0473 family)